MGLMRVLLLGLLVWVVYRFTQTWKIEVSRRRGTGEFSPGDRAGRQNSGIETLQACGGCGVLVPQRQLAGGHCDRCREADRNY